MTNDDVLRDFKRALKAFDECREQLDHAGLGWAENVETAGTAIEAASRYFENSLNAAWEHMEQFEGWSCQPSFPSIPRVCLGRPYGNGYSYPELRHTTCTGNTTFVVTVEGLMITRSPSAPPLDKDCPRDALFLRYLRHL